MPRLRFSDAASAATEIPEASALGWLDLREVWLRDRQMGSPDFANTIAVDAQTRTLRIRQMDGLELSSDKLGLAAPDRGDLTTE